MRVTDTHVYFWGSTFSNFAWTPYSLVIGGQKLDLKTTEQGFMLFKALHFGDAEAVEQIMETPDGKSVKAIGRRVRNFDAAVWDKVCDGYMLRVNFAKYRQHEEARKALFDTGDRIMVEASPTDKIWGVGLHSTDDRILDQANWDGQNRLGKVLIMVREFERDSA